jgi:hypothetical protein
MYKEPHTQEIIDCVAYLAPPSNYLVREDFNV